MRITRYKGQNETVVRNVVIVGSHNRSRTERCHQIQTCSHTAEVFYGDNAHLTGFKAGNQAFPVGMLKIVGESSIIRLTANNKNARQPVLHRLTSGAGRAMPPRCFSLIDPDMRGTGR